MSKPNINATVQGASTGNPCTYVTKVLKGNIPLAEQIEDTNTKYVIKWDFDLDGNIVIIPEGCLIEMDGGSISNGTMIGAHTILIYFQELSDCIKSVTMQGTWKYNNPRDGIMTENIYDENLDETQKQFNARVNIALEEANRRAQAIIPLPDEEDLTTDGAHNIKLKNKAYAPAQFSGLGKTYLRKNIVEIALPFNGFVEDVTLESEGLTSAPAAIFFDSTNGIFVGIDNLLNPKYYGTWLGGSAYNTEGTLADDDEFKNTADNKVYKYNSGSLTLVTTPRRKNILKQNMLSQANTVYNIQYDYDLDGKTIEVPAGTVLEFDNGSFSNGTIIGTNSRISGKPHLNDTILSGTFVGEFSDENVTVSDSNASTFIQNLLSCGFTKTVLNKDYNIEAPHIQLSSGTNLEINGTIKKISYNTAQLDYLFYAKDKSNIHISGNGTIVGDKRLGDGNKEWTHGFVFVHCNNVTLENLTITGFWGDCIAFNQDTSDNDNCNTNILLRNLDLSNVGRDLISLIHVKNCTVDNCYFHDIVFEEGKSISGCVMDIEPNAGTPDAIVEENIRVQNCIIKDCHRAFTIYGAHARVRNVVFENLRFEGIEGSCFGISNADDITIDNVFVGDNIVNVVGLSFVSNVKINNVIATSAIEKFLDLRVAKAVWVRNVICTNVGSFVYYSDVDNLSIENCRITTTDQESNVIVPYADTPTASMDDVFIRNCHFENTISTATTIPTLLNVQKINRLYFIDNYVKNFSVAILNQCNNIFIKGCLFVDGVSTETFISTSGVYDNIVIKDNTLSFTQTKTNLFSLGNGTNKYIIDNIILSGTFNQWYRDQSNWPNKPILKLLLKNIYSTDALPVLTSQNSGESVFDATNKKALWFTNQGWVDAMGNPATTVYPKVIGTPTAGNLAKFNSANATDIEDAGVAPTV